MTESTSPALFTYENEDTCKYGWIFTLRASQSGWIIDDLQIGNREKPAGCSGHPKTIAALLKDSHWKTSTNRD